MKGEDAARRGWIGGFLPAGVPTPEPAVERVIRLLADEVMRQGQGGSRKGARRRIRAYIEASEPARVAWLVGLPDAAVVAFFRAELAPRVREAMAPAVAPESAAVARARADLALRATGTAEARNRLAVALAAEGDRRQSTT